MGKKEKIQLVLIGAIVLGTVLVLGLQNKQDKQEERIWISRPESGTVKQKISMSLGETKEEWELTVEARKKTEEETEAAFSETLSVLHELLKAGTEEPTMLTESVALPRYVEQTGVEIRWSSSDNTVLSKEGEVHREHLKEPQEVTLQARMSFAEEEREHWFSVQVVPYETGSKESLFYGAKEALRELEAEFAGEEGFYLPETVDSVVIGLPEESRVLLGVLAVAVLFLPFAAVITKRQEKEKEKKKREEAFWAAYPQLITKLTLYTGAGLSLRGAWERLATECRSKKEESGKNDVIGDEVLMLAGELKNGTSEEKAYEAFGKRIGLKPYLRCASLLVSQLQKGSGNLRRSLEGEVQLAWEMHRERAAKKGEEAQTKMLFPMMGMLFLVMAVVMIPAFFGM